MQGGWRSSLELGVDHARALADAGDTHGDSAHGKTRHRNLGACIGGHDGSRHLLQVSRGGAQGRVQCRQGRGQLVDWKRYTDDARRRGEHGMRIAAEDRTGADAAFLGGRHAGLAGGAICIAGIDQRNPETMLALFQVALSNDERRSDHFVAGEHRGGGRRPIGHCAGKVRITAGLEAGAHSSEGKAARHLVVAEGRAQER